MKKAYHFYKPIFVIHTVYTVSQDPKNYYALYAAYIKKKIFWKWQNLIFTFFEDLKNVPVEKEENIQNSNNFYFLDFLTNWNNLVYPLLCTKERKSNIFM